MKTTLDHLPERKQQLLRSITDEIRQAADVEMIILFGSHARGDWVDDPVGGYHSDYDVLVIVKSPKLVDKHRLWSDIENRVHKLTAPSNLSLIVHDIKDVNEQLDKGFYFFSDVKREGIMLYDSTRYALAEARTLPPMERKAYAEMNFKEWFGSAKEFLRYFEFGISESSYKSAAFQLHQAAERLYHCALLVLSGYKPKTHNLSDLGRRAGALDGRLRDVFPHATSEERRLWKLLKHAYIDARYSTKYVVTREELETLGGWVRELRDRVECVCRERMETMGDERPSGDVADDTQVIS